MARHRVAPVLAWSLVAVALAAAAPSVAEPTNCDAWRVEYALSANLKLSDTPLGQGDGVFRIGPGKVVLLFDNVGGTPGGAVKMLSYQMKDNFTVKTRTLFWNTTVTNDTQTRGTPDACGVVARGKLDGKSQLNWSSPVLGYRVDGNITCNGSLCGKFGAPPPGTTAIHIGPSPVQFSPFQLRADLRGLQMPFTFVTKTKMPKQTSYVALAGTELKRACVARPKCP